MMKTVIDQAVKKCFDDWQDSCVQNGGFDQRFPMVYDLIVVLQKMTSQNQLQHFFQKTNAFNYLENVMQLEMHKRYIQ